MAYQYTPSPWQKTFHNSTARIKVIWAGRRAGKGRAVLTELMRAITLASKSPFLADKDMAKAAGLKVGYDLTHTLEPAIHIWVVAPNFAQSRQAWNELKQFIPESMVVRRKKTQGGGRGDGWKEDERAVWLNLKSPGLVRRDVYMEIKSADDPESLQTAARLYLDNRVPGHQGSCLEQASTNVELFRQARKGMYRGHTALRAKPLVLKTVQVVTGKSHRGLRGVSCHQLRQRFSFRKTKAGNTR